MKNNKKLLISAAILVGAVFAYYVYVLNQKGNYGQITPETSESPAVSSVSPSSTPLVSEEPFSSINGVKAPATCQVGGEINFSDAGTFSTTDSKISWQNVDSQGRLINWKISPSDSLKIGPNIFANLDVPNGEYKNLTVKLPESPLTKNYILTASVTYGQFVKGDLKIKETNCSGQVKVNLNF